MRIALSSVAAGLDTLAGKVEDRVQNIVGDLIEPLETYRQHYIAEYASSMENGQKYWATYQDGISSSVDARDKFF